MSLIPNKFTEKAKDPLMRKNMKHQFRRAQIFLSIALIIYAMALFYTGSITSLPYVLFIIFFALLLIQIDMNIKGLDLYEHIEDFKKTD